MNRRVLLLFSILAVAIAAPARAVTLSASQSIFVYQFVHDAPAWSFFPALLPAGQTSSGHTTESLVQFNLGGVGLLPDQVAGASLNLWVNDSTAFGLNPSTTVPVKIDVHAAGGAWDASSNWDTTRFAGPVVTSRDVDTVNSWISIDVTSTVKNWLNGATNNGFMLVGNHVVGSPPNNLTPYYIPIFSSSRAANGPQLIINPVPEPASVALAACAVPVAVVYAFRRRRTTRSCA